MNHADEPFGAGEDLGAQLVASEARLRDIIERSPDAFVIVDQLGLVQFANQAAVALFALNESQLRGQLFGFPIAAGETTEVDIVRRHGQALIAEMRVIDTEWDGRPAHVAVLRDVTESKRVEQALEASKRRLSLVMEAARLGYWDVDLVTGSLTCNERLSGMLGYAPGDIEPWRSSWHALLHDDDAEAVEQAYQTHLHGLSPAFSVEMRMRTKAGTWHWVCSRGEVVAWDAQHRPLRFVGIMEDISVRKEAENNARHASLHDPMTQLPNRTLLYEFSNRVLASARRGRRRCAFLFIDLDRFKPINDTYGHGVGDAVLKEVAGRLKMCVRDEDMVGRMGGDEFLIVLAHAGSEVDAAAVAGHVLHRIAQPYAVGGIVLSVSPSIGISLYPLDGSHVDDLIRHADMAMYHAKKQGRHGFQFFKAALNERAALALTIERRLRADLEHRGFSLFFQPIVDTTSLALVGVEALLRWPGTHWEPEQFIPVAETAGFMSALGRWVILEACRQQGDWTRRGRPIVPLSINVSPSQFRNPAFVGDVADAMQRSGVRPESLCIEVTETTLIRDVDEAVTILHALKDMGVKIALDDFGTGYSSLSYLSRLPIDVLKLDQSFVKGITHNRANALIAETVIALGNSLALDVVAEGIESSEDLDFFRSHHCKSGQGFYFCRPVPAPEFEQWSMAR